MTMRKNKHDMNDIPILQFSYLNKGESMLRNEPPPENDYYQWWDEDHVIWKSAQQLTQHINEPKYHPTLGYMWQIGCVYCASLDAYYCEICEEYHCKDAPECGDDEE